MGSSHSSNHLAKLVGLRLVKVKIIFFDFSTDHLIDVSLDFVGGVPSS